MILPGKPLLRLSAWRYARQHPWQSWLSFLGIALGVMMVVAIDLANNSANRAFALAVASVNGQISHQIVGGENGVPDTVFTRLRTELGLRRSAPAITGTVTIDNRQFTLLGQDMFSELSLQRQRAGFSGAAAIFDSSLLSMMMGEPAVLMSQGAAALAGFTAGQQLVLRPGDNLFSNGNPVTVTLAATLPSTDPVATEGMFYTDIAVAQSLLEQQGRLDSIDLILTGDEVETVRAWLPAGLSLVDARTRNDSLEQMTSAFHINLLAMSLLSLLVAALLIYNTVTLSVLRKEKTLGIFRAQGVTRSELYRLVLGEAAINGILASTLGVFLGYLLGSRLLDLVTAAIPDLNYRLNVTSFLVQPSSLFLGFLLGVGITLLSALLPAWRAARARPITLQQRAAHDYHWRRHLPLLTAGGLVMLAAGYLLLRLDSAGLVSGFVALSLLIFGFCFIVPALMALSLSMLLYLSAQHIRLPVRMALRNINSGLNRTGLAVAALTVAISVTVGVGVMTSSFRNTVIIWLDQSFSGDIEITGANLTTGLQQQLAMLDGVERVISSIITTVETDIGQVRLSVRDIPVQEAYYLKQISSEDQQRFNNGEGILLSEPLAWLDSLDIGSNVTLYTDSGEQTFPVLGIFYDYTPSQGMIAVSRPLYENHWSLRPPSRFTVESDGSNASLQADLEAGLATVEEVAIFPNQQIRDLTLAIFDRTFAITNVLRLLAIIIAFIGVLSALMALLLERGREYATLRAEGMTPAQISIMIMGQTALMGLLAGLFSLPLGLLMSDVLIDVINKRSFGWSMQHFLPGAVLGEAIILALTAALLAGIYPAFRSARISPALALREE